MIQLPHLEVVFCQLHLATVMIRTELDDLLIGGKRIAPVLLLLFHLRIEKVGVGILGIDLEDISQRNSGFREIAFLEVLLSLK